MPKSKLEEIFVVKILCNDNLNLYIVRDSVTLAYINIGKLAGDR